MSNTTRASSQELSTMLWNLINPSDCCVPDNTGSLPEVAGRPLLLNAMSCFRLLPFYLHQPQYCRAVAAYLKVVRRRKSSSANGTRGGRAREGDTSSLVRGELGRLPRENFGFLALLCAFFNGFLCVWDQISVTVVC